MSATGVISGIQALSKPGTYALVIECPVALRESVGALGEVRLDAGYLVYVGSAFGSGGLAGRLRHHLRPIHRPRWHVDHLRPHISLLGAWCASGPRRLEHGWAAALAATPGIAAPLAGFGSSDCACATHLFHARRRPAGPWLRERLAGSAAGVGVEYLRLAQLRGVVAAGEVAAVRAASGSRARREGRRTPSRAAESGGRARG